MARIILTKREVWMLHYLLDFYICRYMMCNSKGREDGGEKASNHIEISQRLAMFFLCEGAPRNEETENVVKATMPVHDYLAHIITDRMDEVIDYPIDRPLNSDEFDFYGNKFFEVILEHAREIKEIVMEKKRKKW